MIDPYILAKLIGITKDYKTYGARKFKEVGDVEDYLERKALSK